MQKSVLITLDGPSLEALIFDAVDKAIKINHQTQAYSSNTDTYGDFSWLCAVCIGIPASTLRIKSAAGDIPGTKKIGKRVLYDKTAVLHWIAQQQYVPRSNADEEATEHFNQRHDISAKTSRKPTLQHSANVKGGRQAA